MFNRLAKLWASPWKLNFSMVRQNLMVEVFGRGKVVFCLFFFLSQNIVNSPSPLKKILTTGVPVNKGRFIE